MTGYFQVLENIKQELSTYPLLNTITFGLSDEVDLSKQTIFPLMHFMIIDASPKNNIVTFSLKMFILDIVDINKDGATNNVNYVHNNTYNVALRLHESFLRGQLYDAGLHLNSYKLTAIERAYENYLAGWQIDLSVEIPNHMGIC